MNDHKVELLAPAGNIEAFIGAVNAGADAVYLGGAKFGARAYADNFSIEELVYCIRYAHLFGRKVYLTVNTLMKEDEMKELYDYLAPFYEAGLDAVIVQDFGVFQFIKRNFPDMELHASTQMTVTGPYGASMLKEMGASRIVPARELSLQEIVKMKEETGLEMETFIHGAMCYCYSGQCLFSSILGGRSGNRGRCAQPCRLPYAVNAPESHLPECYPFSLKDMCTIEHIGEFMDAGIDSFKIEGRMKKPEYAAGVTAIYRKYIDQKLKNPQKALPVKKSDMDQLTSLYIRSKRQDGYYYKQNGADMVTLESPAYSGSDDALLTDIRKKYIDKKQKLPISIFASFLCGEEVSLTCVSDCFSATVTGSVMEPAKNQPLSSESIKKQLGKLGDTCFETEYIEVSTDNRGFYSLKAVNELRREAVRKLENKIMEAHGLVSHRELRPKQVIPENEGKIRKNTKEKSGGTENGFSILVSTFGQWVAVSEYLKNFSLPVSRIYVESELLQDAAFLRKLSSEEETEKFPDIYVALPYIMRAKDETLLKKIIAETDAINHTKDPVFQGILVRNIEEYEWIRNSGYAKERKLSLDCSIYIWNEEAYRFWQDKADSVTCPVELNQKEWSVLFRNRAVEKVIYGRLPMMLTANCVSKTSGKCLRSNPSFADRSLDRFSDGTGACVAYLTDRYKKTFPVMLQCAYCLNIVLNSVPLSLHSKESLKWYDHALKRISFTTEKAQEVQRVLQFFDNINKGNLSNPPYSDYTTGHEKRGVE